MDANDREALTNAIKTYCKGMSQLPAPSQDDERRLMEIAYILSSLNMQFTDCIDEFTEIMSQFGPLNPQKDYFESFLSYVDSQIKTFQASITHLMSLQHLSINTISDNPHTLCHYTKLGTLFSIIKENNMLNIWAFRYDRMNDPYDFTFARDRLIENAKKELRLQNISEEEIEELKYNSYPYTISFSKKVDDFVMWRLYQADVAIEIDIEHVIRRLEWYCFHHCYYVNNNEQEILAVRDRLEVELNLDKKISEINKACLYSTFIKYKGFENEGEFRFATWDRDIEEVQTDENGATISDRIVEISTNINVQAANGKSRIYKIITLPGDVLRKIILRIYDKDEFEKTKKHLELYLKKCGYNVHSVDIVQTKAYPINI